MARKQNRRGVTSSSSSNRRSAARRAAKKVSPFAVEPLEPRLLLSYTFAYNPVTHQAAAAGTNASDSLVIDVNAGLLQYSVNGGPGSTNWGGLTVLANAINTVTITPGTGTDSIQLGDGGTAASALGAAFVVDQGNVVNNTSVVIDDSASNAVTTYVVNTGPGFITGGGINYNEPDFAMTGGVDLKGSSAADTYNVLSTSPSSEPVTLDTGVNADTVNVEAVGAGGLGIQGTSGADVVNIGSTLATGDTFGDGSSDLSGIDGTVTVRNAGSFSTLNVDDSGDTSGPTTTFSDLGGGVDSITSTAMSGAIHFITDEVQAVNFDAGSGADTVYVNAIAIAQSGALTIDGGGGDDVVTIGSLASTTAFDSGNSTLDTINAPVTVNNTGGGAVNVDESGSSAADTVTFTNGQISSAIVPFTVNYGSGVGTVQLATGSGNDTVNVNSTLGGATSDIFGNAGDDTLNIAGGNLGAGSIENFYGNDGNDTFIFTLGTGPVTATATVNIDGGAPTTSTPTQVGDTIFYQDHGAFITPDLAVVGKGTITDSGVTNINFVGIETAVTNNLPGVSPVFVPNVGWVVTAQGDADYTGENDTFKIATTVIAGSTWDEFIDNGLVSFMALQTDIKQFNVNGLGGNDTLIVDSTNGPVTPTIFWDGGTGFDALTLTGGTATTDTYAPGPQNGSGSSTIVFPGGTQTVYFQNLEPVEDNVISPLLTVVGTSADNAITYTDGYDFTNPLHPAAAAYGMVTIDNLEYVDFTNKTTLDIDGGRPRDISGNIVPGGSGDNVINLDNPLNTPTGLTAITIDTTYPSTGRDTLVVNGLTGANYSPSATYGSGGITGAGPVPITFKTIAQVDFTGDGASDTLTYTTPVAGAGSVLTYTPGAEPDSAMIDGRVNGGGQLTPLSFNNLGAFGAVTLATLNAGATDYLNLMGTTNADQFVVGAGTAQILEAQPGGVFETVSISTASINILDLHGLGGADTFNLTGPLSYTSTIVDGGGSAVANVTGNFATTVVATMDSVNQLVTVSGGGLGTLAHPLTLSGVELVNLANNNGGQGPITVDGTGANDAFGVTQVDASHTAFTLAGLNTTLTATVVGQPLTLDPGLGNNSVSYTAPAGGVTGIDPTAASVATTGYLPLALIPAHVQSLNVTGSDGTFVVVTAVPATMLLTVDGVAGSGSTLLMNTSGATIVTPGSTGGSVASGTSVVNYVGMSGVLLHGAGADALTIDGTNGDDAIDQVGTQVTVNNGAPIGFPTGGYTALTINGEAGDDVIDVNPAGIGAAITTFNVDGGSPANSDKVIVNGSGAAETVLFTPTGPEAAGVQVGAATTVNITTTELVEIIGAGNDNLQVTTPAATPLTYNPGADRDSGSVQAGSLVPMTFQNLGTASTVTLSDAGGPLTYNGTAGNDLFTVAAGGAIGLNTQLSVATVGVTGLTLNGVSGNDTFDVAGGAAFPYTAGVALSGGPSLNDVATLTGDGLAQVVLNNFGGVTANVTGGGLSTVLLTGIEVLYLNAGGAGASVLGTAGPDVWSATPTGANAATIQAAGFSPLTYLTAAASLLLTPSGGGDQVTVNGTVGPDTINVVNNAVTTTVTVDAFLPVGVDTASLNTTGSLWVSAGTGDDTINVSGTNGPALVVDGGLPTASDKLNVTVTNPGPTTIKASVIPGTGVIDTPDYTLPNSITYVGIEGIFVSAPAGGTLVVDGTNASNAIDYVEGVNPVTLLVDPAYGRVLVDNQTPIDFTNVVTLAIDGLGGDDVINLNNPHTPTLLTGISVDGGDPTASDKVIVNGTGLGETINFAPTFGTDDGATVTVGGLVPVVITTTELIDIVGAGADNLLVTSPIGGQDVTLTPGATVDSGSVQVDSYVPMTFRNIGGSTVAISDLGGTLTYNGTAGNDLFTVASGGAIGLNNQVGVTTSGMTGLVLNGLGGNNTFGIAGGVAFPYSTVSVDPSGFNVVNLTGDGAGATATMDYTTGQTVVSGGGLGTETLAGVDLVTLANVAGTVLVEGTGTTNDAFSVSQVNATNTAFTLAGLSTTLDVSAVAGGLTLDPGTGTTNSVTYTAPAAGTTAIDPTAVAIATTGYQTLNLTAADVGSLLVNGLDGNFTVTTPVPAAMLLTVDGGADGTLGVTTAGPATTVTPGATGDAGEVVSGTSTVHYAGMDLVNLTGPGGAALTIDGTNGNDAIDQTGNVVTVNNDAPIDFSGGGYTTLNLAALAGDDVINVNPTGALGLVGITTFNVDGGSPTASDKVIVNGTAAGADVFAYDPTGANSANVTVNGLVVGVSNTEQLVINGLGSTTTGDLLTVTTLANVNTFNYTPGATPDSGSFQVGSLLPMSFTDLGVGSNYVAVVGGAGSSLVYNGTVNSDAFGVTSVAGSGEVTLTAIGTTYVPVRTDPAVTTLTVNGIGGNDRFTVAAGNPYAGIALNGGPSLTDVATLNGNGLSTETVTMDSTTGVTTVANAGLGSVAILGVELVNVDNSAGAAGVTIAGTSLTNDLFGVTQVNGNHTAFTMTGVNATVVADAVGGALTLDPGTGTTNGVTYTATAGNDVIGINQTAGTVTLPLYQTLFLNRTDVSTLQVNGSDGADTFNVTGNAAWNLIVNGGSPASFGGASIDTLNVLTSGGTTVTPGATGDAGQITSLLNGTVSYLGIEKVVLTGTAPEKLTIDGTNGNDAIDQTLGTEVTVNNGAPIDFNVGNSNYTELDINGLAGDDVINVTPGALAAGMVFRVDGGSPTASDEVIVNGTGAINFTPTGPASADVTAGALVHITNTEQIVIDGQPGPDVLTVTGGASPITYNPGAVLDSGSVQVASLVPLSFENLGAGGSVTLNTTGGVVYNGTASDDTFVVNAADTITLLNSITLLNRQLPVTTVGVTVLTLNGVSGNDLFNVTGGGSYTYTSLILSGGSSLNDVANLTGSGAAVNLNNLGGTTANVTGGGLGRVSLPGIEVLYLNAGTAAAGVFGTSGPDNWTVTPTGASSATIQASGFSPLTYLTAATALTLDPSSGGDQITVNGTPGNDTINVVRGAAATTVQVNPPWLTATVAADTTALVVAAGMGDDIINVTETGVSPTGLTVNGGLPTASDTLTFTNNANGTTELKPGSSPDSGVVVAADASTISFLGIEKISLAGLAPSASNNLLIDGTAGSDLISLYNTGSGNTAQVNSQAPVTFTAFGGVALNGISGDDTFNVSPVGLTNVTAIAVNGSATGTAAVNVNGSSATENITVAMGAVPTVAGLGALVTITNPTSIAINGETGNDNLTVTTPVNSAIAYTPGATIDSASMQVNSLAPLSFSGLGSSGTVLLTGTGTATLAYNGTAVDDTFTVSALNVITLNKQLTVTTSGITGLTLNGLAGNNTFNLTGGYAYTSVTLDPSGSNVANLTGTGLAPVTLNNLGGAAPTVTGGGLGTVNLSGVGVLNLNAFSVATMVTGTTGPDNLSVTPTGTNAATIQATGFFPVTNLTNATSLLVNTLGGSDLLSVYATQAGDAVTVNGTTSTVTVGTWLPVVYSNTASVSVYGLDGSDTFTVTPSATVPFFIDGGNPIGVQPGDKIVLNAPGATTFYPGPLSDQGGFLFGTPAGSLDQAVSFTHIESVTVTGAPSATILGTSGDDQITITARDSSYDPLADGVQDFTVEMNGAPTILFINTPAVSVNSGAGDDLIVVHAPAPNLANWNVTLTIDGGSPGASDELIVETPGNQALATYTPSGPTAGSLVVGTIIPSMTITDIEQFIYDGMGTDNLTVTGAGAFNLTPATVDAGQVALTPTGGQQWLPVGYQEVGSLTVNGTGGADTLVYNGTNANDTFAVATTTGTVTLANATGSYIPVLQTGVENLTINSLNGNDTFNVAGGQPYTNLQLDGAGDPTTNLTGATGTVTITLADSVLDTNTTVTGYGGTIILSGVDVLNASANSHAVVIDGTAEADSIAYTPTGAAAATVTEAGLGLTINASGVTGTFTIDPIGSAPANTVTVDAPASGGSITATGGATPTIQVGALQTLSLVAADTQSLVVEGGNGNDALTVNSTTSPFLIPVLFDGGTGADSLTLTGGTALSDTYAAGPQAGTGSSTLVFAGGTQTVNFANLEPVTDTVVSPTLVVNGNTADNTIDYTVGATAALGRVSVDDQEYIDFNNKTALTINGIGGDNVFNLNNPNTPTGLTGITVNGTFTGGAATGTDTLVANGTAGADTINFTPTSANGGTITGTGPVPITFATTEQVVINGQGGNDNLTVTAPAGNKVTYTPGATVDSASVQVASLVPMSFLNLGSTGNGVTVSDVGGKLVYNGKASDDTFTVTALGVVTLNTQIPVTPAGLTSLTLNGQDSNDTFNVAGGASFPYTAGVTLSGGSSQNDTANLTGATGAVAVNLGDSVTSTPTTVTGYGGTVTLLGVEVLNANANANNVTVNGTAESDNLTYTPTGALAGTVTNSGSNLTVNVSNVSNTAGVATPGAFTIDPVGASPANVNTLTVNGTAGADTIGVVNGAVTTTVKVNTWLTATVVTADTASLVVLGGTGDDIINVSGTGGPALTVNGGLPTASDTLNITNTNPSTVLNPTKFNPGTTPDSGTIATPDYTVPVSFLGIEHITLTGVTPVGAATDVLVIDGTSGSDLMNLYNTGSGNTALVNDHAPVIFSNFGPVTLDGIGGNDTFNVSPVGLVGVTGITVNGHAATGGTAAAIVNGSSAADNITVTATSATTVTVAIAGSPTVSIDPVSSLTVNGLGGNNMFTVTDGTPGISGPTPLSAPITLMGGANNDTFNIGAYTGELLVKGAQGSDTLNFAGAPGDGSGFGVTIDLDTINFAQTVDPDGETVNLMDSVENFVGSSFDDKVTVDASTTPRLINGGLPNKPTSPNYSTTPTPTVTGIAVTGASGQYGTGLDGVYLNRGLMLNGKPIYVDSSNVSDTLSFDGTNWDLYASGTPVYTGAAVPGALANNSTPGYTGTATAAVKSPVNQLAPIPPGDQLTVDGEDQFVNIIHTNVDSGTVTAFSYAPVTFTQIEKIEVTNSLGSTSNTSSGSLPTYTTAVPYATDGRPVSEAVGDINGDGIVDMVVACIDTLGQPVVDVFIGNGDGSFQPEATYLVEPVNYIGGVQAVKLADMNGDGNLDIVTLNMDSTVSVLSGSGTGAFSSPVVTKMYTTAGPANSSARNPIALAVGDLNNDGFPDLVTANYGSASVTVLMNNGSGGLTPTTYKSGGSYPSDVALMDVNGDGLKDILVVNRGTWTMAELWNTGGGVFGPVNPINPLLARVPTTLNLVNKIKSPIFSIQTTDNAGSYLDFNQDGIPDILLSTLNGSAVTILEGNSTTKTTGAFTVQPQVPYTGVVASAVVSAQAADLNGDGKVDLVLTGRHTVQVLMGNGNGTFATPLTLSLPSQINLGPQKPLLVDLNNDGGIDILSPDVLTHVINVLLRSPLV